MITMIQNKGEFDFGGGEIIGVSASMSGAISIAQ
jgi:hypothetical protein